jgi:dTDP-4-amino-4,6-dideoxy-D-galactose acyltransferase
MPWDSDFFGFSVAKVRRDVLDSQSAIAIDAWCREHEVRWLNFVARPDDVQTVLLAERHGYHLADVRMTYGRDLSEPHPPVPHLDEVRLVDPRDVPGLMRIASVSHGDARIYHDGNLPREVCDRFFATWIKNSCEGFANAVLVTGEIGDPTGYVTCHYNNGGAAGSNGLMAVDRRSQGKGLGVSLMAGALRWLADRGAKRAVLVTQGRNLVAQRVYQKLGFLIRKLELQYHKWYAPMAAAHPTPVNQDVPRSEWPAVPRHAAVEHQAVESERLVPTSTGAGREKLEVS